MYALWHFWVVFVPSVSVIIFVHCNSFIWPIVITLGGLILLYRHLQHKHSFAGLRCYELLQFLMKVLK